uniref:Hemoglobin cathodic subunit alpha n=1 Tax=Gymnothorax unicolor TaxID=296138 RepID=HBAC_GYMUN|nr:RecName: Full=Hemoglobin cathodic subunit alpha; AltName: Full=Hemoglobin cathodic alpha chain [Gymnothorax unicolor]
SLAPGDKTVVKKFWEKVGGQADEIGGEALSRMIAVYPPTRIYFSHWPDLAPGSPSVKKHGKKIIMKAVSDSVGKMDNLVGGLSALSDLHATRLHIDPSNFKILSHNILVTLAAHFPSDFTAEVHVAMDKFLSAVCAALSDKYR